jgi:Protein of unknown function (DUF1572).
MDKSESIAAYALELAIADFRGTKKLGDGALKQLSEERIGWKPEPESNSVAVIVQHMAGNMLSRWTDFLTSDGEKPDRNRDAEFEEKEWTREALIELWERGWKALFDALESLSPDDLLRTATIRGEPHTVLKAIHRQITHLSYHTGQIVYLVKATRSASWNTLSIAKGQSRAFNEKMAGRSN